MGVDSLFMFTVALIGPPLKEFNFYDDGVIFPIAAAVVVGAPILAEPSTMVGPLY